MVSRSAPVSLSCGVAVALLLGEVHAQQEKAAPTPLLEIAQRAAPRKQTTKHLPGVDPVVGSALQWLLAQQQADGRWPADDFLAASGDNPVAATDCTTSTIAITGLALWALAREGPAADGDPRREPMLRAARWLMRQQPNDVIGHPDAHHFVYGHAIGLLGLCATVAATGDDTCREAAERAYTYLEKHRNPYAAWRHQPRDNDNDVSVTSWAALSYLAANDIGVRTNGNALLFARYLAMQCSDEQGAVGYTKPGSSTPRFEANGAAVFPPESPAAMTAAGLLCRLTSGEPLVDPQLRRDRSTFPPAQTTLTAALATLPEWREQRDGVDLCQWLFTAEALRIVDRLEPDPARADAKRRTQWRTALAEALIKGQRVDGDLAGSWNPTGPWGAAGGRIHSTAMAVLALQALYRLPDALPR